jgi:hypothetical protein
MFCGLRAARRKENMRSVPHRNSQCFGKPPVFGNGVTHKLPQHKNLCCISLCILSELSMLTNFHILFLFAFIPILISPFLRHLMPNCLGSRGLLRGKISGNSNCCPIYKGYIYRIHRRVCTAHADL